MLIQGISTFLAVAEHKKKSNFNMKHSALDQYNYFMRNTRIENIYEFQHLVDFLYI